MRHAWIAFALVAMVAHAQDTDLTPAVRSTEIWDKVASPHGWSRPQTQGARLFKTCLVPTSVFGLQPASVSACFENEQINTLTIVFLDSGAWFGFVPDDQQKTVAATRGPEFARLYKETAATVRRELDALGPGREVTLGATQWLKHKAVIYQYGGLGARLTLWPDQLIKLTLFRNPADAPQLLDAWRRAPDRAVQARTLAANLRTTPAGDRILDGLPVFPQGDRAYCGVSALAMTMRAAGLTLDTEDFAAGAGIRYGSTQKSHIREVYQAAAREAGLGMAHGTRFEFARAQQSIDAGFPVIVFRRWDQQRDYLHSAFAQRFAQDPAAQLPVADLAERKMWPTKEGFAHASVINGYNSARREVIFSESWAESVRNRRMRAEEMEATVYLVYYPRL